MKVNFNVLNQKSAPALYESSLANRPTAGYMGRLFIDTDIPSTGIYWDSGTAWYKIASASTAETQSLNDVCVIGNSTVTLGTYIFGQSTYGQKSGAAIPVEPDYALTIGRGDSVNDKSLYVAFNSILNGLVNVIGGNTASNPGLKVSGGWYSGGSATTTKPQLLVEPNSTTSTAWSTLGTGIGINAATGFTGRLFDFQINAVSKAVLLANGNLGIGLVSPTATIHVQGSGSTSATTSLLVQNSTNAQSLKFTDDGAFRIDGVNGAAYGLSYYSSGVLRFGVVGYGGVYNDSLTVGASGIILTATVSAGLAVNTASEQAMIQTRVMSSKTYAYVAKGSNGINQFRVYDTSGTQLGSGSKFASAYLQVDSTTQGFLPPRMTTTEKTAIASPAAGLMVYDTTLNKLCVFTTAWETITSI